MRIAVVGCESIRRELEALIEGDDAFAERVYLGSRLHVDPVRMRERVIEEIEAAASGADVVLLGYGRCGGLAGIADEVDVPVVTLDADDCLAIHMTPEGHAAEREQEAGTWFMTPAWSEVGIDMVVRELGVEEAAALGHDPAALTKRLFAGYTRGLYVETGAGDGSAREAARRFCDDLSLRFEETDADSPLLADAVARAKAAAGH